MNEQTAIITAGASGICLEVALDLANRCKQVIVIDKDEKELCKLADRKIANIMPVHCDVEDIQAAEKTIAGILAEDIKPTILINGVGGDARRIPFQSLTESDLLLSLSQNLATAFTMTRLLIPAMVEQRYGRIVNFASVAGRTYTVFSNTAYVCAKSAVLGLTKQLAYEFAGTGITVNSVAHGPIATPRIRKAWEDKTQREQSAILSKIPMRRMGEVKEAAAAVLFLCSEEAGYTTGSVIDCNGGMYI